MNQTSNSAPTPQFIEALDDASGVAKVSEVFKNAFGCDPAGVWAAPGRVNLIGEHTDYNGGLCLPIALPHRTFIAMKPRSDRKVRLATALNPSTQPEFDLDEVGPVGTPGEVKSWPAYIVGVLWALEQAGYGPLPGFDIADATCVPLGSGLSSSAALECAVAVAAADLAGLEISRKELVEVCRQAENDMAGAPTGGLDQSASLLCSAGHALLLDFMDMSSEAIPFDLEAAGLELLVIDTNAPHKLNDGQYAERRQSCEEAARLLGVELLAELAGADLEEIMAKLPDETIRARVHHVLTEIERTEAAVELLRQGPPQGDSLAELKVLLEASHNSLRYDYQVTCPELDLAVEVAMPHAFGARMTGGGFGGSAIALLPSGRSGSVAAEIAEAFAAAGFRAPRFLIARPANPAGRVS